MRYSTWHETISFVEVVFDDIELESGASEDLRSKAMVFGGRFWIQDGK